MDSIIHKRNANQRTHAVTSTAWLVVLDFANEASRAAPHGNRSTAYEQRHPFVAMP